MKRIYYLLISFLLITPMLQAQKPLAFHDGSQSKGNVDIPGLWVSIPEAKAEKVMADWTKAIEKGTKSKAVVNGMDASLFGAIIKSIYADPINIESRVRSEDTVVWLFAGVELRRGEFAEKGTKEYDKLKDYLKDFAKSEYVSVAEEQLAKEEAQLKSLEKELSSIRKDKSKMDKTVQSSQNAIAAEQDKITSYQKQLAVVNENIDNISTKLSQAEDAETKKAWQGELKAAQKKKKSLQKSINSSESKISKTQDKSRDTRNNIELNLGNQDQTSIRINEQKMVVTNLKNKVKTIKGY